MCNKDNCSFQVISLSIESRVTVLSFKDLHKMVRGKGLEPSCLAALPPQGSVSAISPPAHIGVVIECPRIIGITRFLGKQKLEEFLTSSWVEHFDF
jgi:hypothetical protein